jgi:hypothetical protein
MCRSFALSVKYNGLQKTGSSKNIRHGVDLPAPIQATAATAAATSTELQKDIRGGGEESFERLLPPARRSRHRCRKQLQLLIGIV